ncbi:MAG: esterase [Lachnospiraceae bacterium]|nr:esterase [Lachnospiraceae bacterium]
MEVGLKELLLYGNKDSDIICLQMTGEHEIPYLQKEYELIREMSKKDMLLACVKVGFWGRELSPWEAEAAFGDENFGDGAGETLKYVLENVVPEVLNGRKMKDVRFYLGGYSLSGLFSLWAACNTDIFTGIAAVSPSVWFSGFVDYVRKNEIYTEKLYLSLGDKEDKTKNVIMKNVKNAIEEIYDMALNRGIPCTLEYNTGGHFKDMEFRMAKGFAKSIINDVK